MKLHEIGLNIRKLRKENSLTQEKLASMCGISRVTLGKLERGEIVSISLKTLDIVLQSLNHEIDFMKKQNFGLPSLDEL